MPQIRMIMACPVKARRRAIGDLLEVDHQTARALVHLRIAEYEPALSVEELQFKRAVVTPEAIDKPRKRKRGYLRAGQ
jgi:hypothetical protein